MYFVGNDPEWISQIVIRTRRAGDLDELVFVQRWYRVELSTDRVCFLGQANRVSPLSSRKAAATPPAPAPATRTSQLISSG